MNETTEWQINYDAELKQAEQARSLGNEGMARVCARRAAGIVVGEYLRRQNLPTLGPSAYDRLNYLLSMPGMSAANREIAKHLTLRVTTDHTLPVDVDLIAEARKLAANLLGEGK